MILSTIRAASTAKATMIVRRVFWPLMVVCPLFANPAPTAAAAAIPAGLRGHSLAVAWTDDRTIRDPSGREKQLAQTSALTLYVSGAGRVFSRFDRSTGRSDTSSLLQVSGAPSDFLHWNWEGGSLVADQHFDRGARRVIISFGEGWSNCTLRVLHGKEVGSSSIVYSGYRDGVKYQILSIAVTSTSCTIQPGNVFSGAQ